MSSLPAWAVSIKFSVQRSCRFQPCCSSSRRPLPASPSSSLLNTVPQTREQNHVDASPLTKEEIAYILQPSPYRSLRTRNYSSSPGKRRTDDNEEDLTIETAPTTIAHENVISEPVPDDVAALPSHQAVLDKFHAMSGDPLESDGGRVVVHRGDPLAKLMVIGEAPGENEDKEGKPFVGKAGQLLDKIFAYGGFDMEKQVYITNVVKRRPRNNRTPTKAEIEYYLPSLLEEIAVVGPKVIVLAGSIAAKAVLGHDTRITKVRGQWFKLGEDGADIMPVFHPSYLLRYPENKRAMVTDIEEIRAKFMELVPEEELGPLLKR